MKTRVSQFWRALGSQLVSSVAMSEDFKCTQFIVFLFARCLFGEFFLMIFGTAVSRQVKENFCNAQSIPVRLHCSFENCHRSYNSKKHINEHFLSIAMDRHVFENKTSGHAWLWETALKFLAEAFLWRHQITWSRWNRECTCVLPPCYSLPFC